MYMQHHNSHIRTSAYLFTVNHFIKNNLITDTQNLASKCHCVNLNQDKNLWKTSQLNLLYQQSLKVGRLANEGEIKTQVLQRVTKIFPKTDTELIQYTQRNNKIESHESPEGGKCNNAPEFSEQNWVGGGGVVDM